MMLQPLVTSCTEDYKGHSLVQTSFTELPSSMTDVGALNFWQGINKYMYNPPLQTATN